MKADPCGSGSTALVVITLLNKKFTPPRLFYRTNGSIGTWLEPEPEHWTRRSRAG